MRDKMNEKEDADETIKERDLILNSVKKAIEDKFGLDVYIIMGGT